LQKGKGKTKGKADRSLLEAGAEVFPELNLLGLRVRPSM
jgi:hypothetical protein